MATILEFRRNEEAAAGAGRPVEGTLGEIIIFPGVRIERRDSGDTSRQTPSPARRRTPRVRKKSQA